MAILPPDPSYMLRGDMGPVHSLLFRITPYIEHLYAGTESGNIHIWDLKVRNAIEKSYTQIRANEKYTVTKINYGSTEESRNIEIRSKKRDMLISESCRR